MKLTNVINNRRVKKVFCVFALILVMACVMVPTVFADTDLNYAENAATTILDNLFWIVLIVAGVLLVGTFLKRSYIGAIVIILVGGLICVLLKNPTIISNIGEAFAKILGLV